VSGKEISKASLLIPFPRFKRRFRQALRNNHRLYSGSTEPFTLPRLMRKACLAPSFLAELNLSNF
jgi:hypothetical protein